MNNPVWGDISHLHEPDAQQMEMFLVSDLKVPKDHIISLYDRYASRKAIMNAFMMLQKDPRIHEGDPILIFFAGHGGLAEAEPKWRQKYGSSKIQVIFPYDYGLPVSNSNSSVDCIPDVTIAELLNQLAAAKGNNILYSIRVTPLQEHVMIWNDLV
ncbi:ICE-like protease (caspase) p20 domain protein [Rhizoctonia solani]|uniref:ICE-like protease (Caspase) p20 domain protein n=1 Tax=Rhizoctonia solani TaxID=456999 RepID=A0A8H8T1P0_9AGAM|nr:ICE-like protease (caspase) p20 domain protein [Rhizoctonia solani]QRW26009.1 ICE-like protease (caspase) p20 domain protein [Rhizoctonia solani]